MTAILKIIGIAFIIFSVLVSYRSVRVASDADRREEEMKKK